jgi:hypothetical protein
VPILSCSDARVESSFVSLLRFPVSMNVKEKEKGGIIDAFVSFSVRVGVVTRVGLVSHRRSWDRSCSPAEKRRTGSHRSVSHSRHNALLAWIS